MSICFTVIDSAAFGGFDDFEGIFQISRVHLSTLSDYHLARVMSECLSRDYKVWLSTSLECTWRFVCEQTAPGCLMVLDCTRLRSENSAKDMLCKVLAASNGTFLLLKMQRLEWEDGFWHQQPSEQILELDGPNPVDDEAIVQRIESLTTRTLENARRLCGLVEAHSPRRNPLRIERWVCSALDDSFVHPCCAPADITDLKQPFDDAGLEARLNEWEFTALDMQKDDILRLIWRIFEDFGLPSDVDSTIFAAFLHAIYANYFDNPYHNIYHVVDVLQCCYFLLKFRVPQLRAILTEDDVFALCVACLCHDVGHPSFGNSILRESGHPLSILYNDTSVLENMHATVLFSILRQPCYDFLRGWSEERRKRFRKRVVAWTLATDMSSHFDFIRRFDETFPCLGPDCSAELTEEQRNQLCIALIKCSDISNVIRPFEVAKRWGVALLNEFLLQGDYERLLGLPVPPLNDRATMKTGQGQYSFLTMVAAPLYRSIARKTGGLELFEELISANASAWQRFDDSSVSFAS